MTDLVPADQIEQIVGIQRHATAHFGRAVSTEQTVYILHSEECRTTTSDLRDCPFSVALDQGIEHFIPWTGWRRLMDRPVELAVFRGYLLPRLSAETGGEPA